MFRFRDRELGARIFERLKSLELDIRIMHVCGTHQDTLMRFGLAPLFRDAGIEIRQGPGCPVCVTTPRELEEAILLAESGKTIAVFGDMMRVPGVSRSLEAAKAAGSDVRVVYGIDDAIALANRGKELVFMAVGFETTAPTTASAILSRPPPGFSILCCHRTIPLALKALLDMGEMQIDGFINPGHVSAITGTAVYDFISRDYGMPQVVAGFEPLDLVMGVYMLARQIRNGEAKVENEYTRVVKPEGNRRALGIMDAVFEPCHVAWRGFPVLPGTGLGLKADFEEFDARKKYEEILSGLDTHIGEPEGCCCGEVLRGLMEPDVCSLFGSECTPEHPVGPCMVSSEGGCCIAFRYGR
ncbi:MAG TPA: hydrogenase formation protein HypD [Candidatus Methanoperedenaceae archaeon]|nr:hydrogenase formation protein HypD [Candidatus Methanoperedenaceae archaeon]